MRSKAMEIIKMANNIDINIVTKLLMEQGLLGKKKAGDKGFLCPYHSEKSGSFLIYKNIGKCFGCEISVRTPMLYADVHLKHKINELRKDNPSITSDELLEIYEKEKHLALWEAAVELCYQNELISKKRKLRHLDLIEECRESGNIPELYKLKPSKNINEVSFDNEYEFADTTGNFYINEINTLSDVAKKVLSNYDYDIIASRRELHIIYTVFRETIEEVRGNALLPHHRKHLNEVRFLPDNYIEFYKYFSLPTGKEKRIVIKKLLEKLKSFGMDLNTLKITPGFIFDKDRGKYDTFEMRNIDSIGIPMEDVYSNSKRIQLRPDSGMKTAWFSTPEAGNCKAPSTVRYPIDTNYKDLINGNLKTNNIIYTQVDKETTCIPTDKDEISLGFTEGDYKAVHTSNLLNSLCLSTQGLTPWYNMFVEYTRIKDLLFKHNKKVSKGFIIFDCDTKFKKGLIDKGKGVHRVLKSEGIDAYYITWRHEYGKGIDDVINNGYQDKLVIVSADIYERKYDLIIDILAMLSRTPKMYLDEEAIKPYYEDLEEYTVKELEDMLEKMKLTNKITEKMYGKKMSKLTQDEILSIGNKIKDKTLDELRDFYDGM